MPVKLLLAYHLRARHNLSSPETTYKGKGYTLLALTLYWKRGKCKVELGLAKGKQSHDKRATERDRDWAREKERLLKNTR